MINFNDFLAITSPTQTQTNKNVTQPIEAEAKKTDESKVLVANPSNMVLSRGKFALVLASVGTLAATVAWGISKGKTDDLLKQLRKLEDQLKNTKDVSDELQNAKKALEELQSKLKDLEGKYKDATSIPKEAKEALEVKIKHYRELIGNTTSIYDKAVAPSTKEGYKPSYKKIFDFGSGYSQVGSKEKATYAQNLIRQFDKRKSITIFRQNEYVAPTQEAIQKAMLPDNIEDLGRKVQSDFTIAYGRRTGWSDEKIARDILQNFYDGGNFSLDGTNIRIHQLKNGKFSIKIEGDGVFKYTDLKLMGSGNKLENPKSAGGFGEGIKVVIANLFDKGYTQEIKFKSADWEYIFDTQDEIITRTLKKTSEISHGNFLEFETDNEGFIRKLINAIDFFEHKNNPDFKNLTFENDQFGFRVLNKGEKGNFYLTQRFEYGENGAWENNVEGLNLIFKQKPDFEEFERITGKKFDTGRDRKNMDADDVYNLIKYFSKKMSTEEKVQALLSTQAHWSDLSVEKPTAIKSMIKALCESLKEDKVAINFEDVKLCAYTGGNGTLQEAVKGLGYKLIDDRGIGFNKIGMSDAREIFEKMSQHVALKPTKTEAQKLKVLEEATRVIQEGFEETYLIKLKELFAKLTPEDFKVKKSDSWLISDAIFANLKLGDDIVKSEGFRYNIVDEDKFAQALYDYSIDLVDKMDSVGPWGDFISKISMVLSRNSEKNPLLSQIATQLSNIEIIKKADVSAPRFIFDRKTELAKSTLGEAITELGLNFKQEYKGHWVDRTYLNSASFPELVATWLHEICHKSGGDGTSEFTYKLTDMIQSYIEFSTKNNQTQLDLIALEKVFNEIK